jgi:hypothetical protein
MKTLSQVALATSIAAMFGCGSGGDGNQTPLQTPFAPGGTPGGGGAPAAGATPGAGSAVAAGGGAGGLAAGGTVAAGGAVSAGGVVGTGGVAAGGTASAGGAISAGGVTGSGGAAEPPDANTATLTMQSFRVNPGGEVFMCQNYDNPFGGQDVGLTKIATDMSPGSHHLHIFYGSTSANRNIESCSGV